MYNDYICYVTIDLIVIPINTKHISLMLGDLSCLSLYSPKILKRRREEEEEMFFVDDNYIIVQKL